MAGQRDPGEEDERREYEEGGQRGEGGASIERKAATIRSSTR